jgi:large subunit ribosomal protein L22
MLVEAAYADEGPTLKRWKPRARGRVNRIRKRTCHVTLVLVERPPERASRRRRPAAAATAETKAPAAAEKPAKSTSRRRKAAVSTTEATEGAEA